MSETVTDISALVAHFSLRGVESVHLWSGYLGSCDLPNAASERTIIVLRFVA